MEDMSHDTHTRETYHHGNLPDALVKEGAKLLAELGADGFSLRQLAKRTGVTVAAPSHHFGSTRGLLTAIATAGFDKLASQLEGAAAIAQSPEDAVLLMCKAYLEMSITNPGYAIVMFRLDLLHAADESFRESAFRAFGLLKQALTKAVPDTVDDAQISMAAKALWATTHGLTALPIIEDKEVAQILRTSVAIHLAGLQ